MYLIPCGSIEDSCFHFDVITQEWRFCNSREGLKYIDHIRLNLLSSPTTEEFVHIHHRHHRLLNMIICELNRAMQI